MNIYYLVTIGAIVGYICGSIPFALIIGKLFYKTDVRHHGSGNLGSTNVARTLGPLAGITVMILDVLKGGLPAFIMYKISENVLLNSLEFNHQVVYLSIVYCVTGVMSAIGHCHPLFANFKGGKAVASIFGFIVLMNWKLAVVGAVTYVLVLLITKIVSVASITGAINVVIACFIPYINEAHLFKHGELQNEFSVYIYYVCIIMLALLLIYKHIPNIKRIALGQENKFKFEHKKIKLERKNKANKNDGSN